MKKICLSAFVFGDQYQNYIPIYIYSILKAYPDYFIVISTEKKLNNHILKQINILREYNNNFIIKENYINQNSNNISSLKSYRWLYLLKEYNQFNSVYIGDVDIFICKENPGIFEQHSNHCKLLNLPFSNVIRKNLDKKNFSFFASRYRRHGIPGIVSGVLKNSRYEKRLTGLHFFIVDEYIKLIEKKNEKYLKKVNRLNFCDLLKFKNHFNGFNDEAVLYDLLIDAGLDLNVLGTYKLDEEILSYNNYDQKQFRPHHGLHFGAFLNEVQVKRNNYILSSSIYEEYFKYFENTLNNDDLFKSISKYFSSFQKTLIDKALSIQNQLKASKSKNEI